MRLLADRETTRTRAADANREQLFQLVAIGGRVAGGDRLSGTFQEPVDDLHSRRAVTQDGERVDESLDRVVTIDQRIEVLRVPDAI